MKAFHFGNVTSFEVRGTSTDTKGEVVHHITLTNRTRGTETSLQITKSQLEAILKDLK